MCGFKQTRPISQTREVLVRQGYIPIGQIYNFPSQEQGKLHRTFREIVSADVDIDPNSLRLIKCITIKPKIKKGWPLCRKSSSTIAIAIIDIANCWIPCPCRKWPQLSRCAEGCE